MPKITQSIDRALQVLELFVKEKSEWGVTEISEALNFYKSSVYNILATLEARGFVYQNPENEKYSLGIKLFELGNVVLQDLDLRKVAFPYIDRLSRQFNETVHLGILSDDEVLSIEQQESNHSLRPRNYIGKKAPLYCTAVGKAILAYLGEDKMDDFLNTHQLKPYTDNTITDPGELRQELSKIRKQGYAVDNMEHEDGVRCLAAPIRDYSGKVIASISISGPQTRIKKKDIPSISQKIIEYCQRISQKMGYK